MKNRTLYLLFFLAAICSFHAKVRLPALVSDGMILQRNQDLKIWGYADAGEKITIKFINKTYNATADQRGNWSLMLPKLNAGGPYTMMINEITLKDILIGDVWVASGQSNMELPMRRLTPLYENEIKNANNQNIRFFTVPQKYNFKAPQNDLDGGSGKVPILRLFLIFRGCLFLCERIK